MTNPGQFGEGQNASREAGQLPEQGQSAGEIRNARIRAVSYPDMQSAVRFPVKLPVSVKLQSGASATETQNISANGVLFEVESDMPVGSVVDFTISLPAGVVGAAHDVRVDCRGRVVRSSEHDGRRGIGVVIDEYRFERR
jgi:hypothetical protein